jgi:hypothetical protein
MLPFNLISNKIISNNSHWDLFCFHKRMQTSNITKKYKIHINMHINYPNICHYERSFMLLDLVKQCPKSKFYSQFVQVLIFLVIVELEFSSSGVNLQELLLALMVVQTFQCFWKRSADAL